jgi:hypothetical protein
VAKNDRCFRVHLYPHHQGLMSPDVRHHTLKKGTWMIPETSVVFNKLTQLLAREDFIKF